MSVSERKNKRKASTPTDGYICSICSKPGHWVQQCPDKQRKKNKNNKNHVYTPGVDPSDADIEKARELQKIKPPNCFCGIPSRLKKVKRSHAADNSRAIGKYFFFCSKRKDDTTKCRFARPVEDETKAKKDIVCTFFAKRGFCMRGERCMYKHELNTENQTSFSNVKDSLESVMETKVGQNHSYSKESKNDDNCNSIKNKARAESLDRNGSNSSNDDCSSSSDSSSANSSSNSSSSSSSHDSSSESSSSSSSSDIDSSSDSDSDVQAS